RRHGQVRAGLASSYLRGDPSALAGLVEDRALSTLGLLRLAPTVIVAQVPTAVLVAALRERGHSPVTEDPSGNLVVADQRPRRVRVPRRRGSPGRVETTADDARARRLRRLAKDLLSADRRELVASYEAGTDAGAPDQGPPDPVLALALLRDAAAQGREVWLEVVGPQGITERRRVRPLRVDGGRVRAVDPEREAELTVAVHRIAHVTPIEGAG
ncbi:MAG: hypothetical protein HGA44_19435, partial [Cellulomonadaceae bacterium]|nr:hypothetical protein [Cellulomonadaceae bacterium]